MLGRQSGKGKVKSGAHAMAVRGGVLSSSSLALAACLGGEPVTQTRACVTFRVPHFDLPQSGLAYDIF